MEGQLSHTKLQAELSTPITSVIRDMGVSVKQRLVYFENKPKKTTSKHCHLEVNKTGGIEGDCSMGNEGDDDDEDQDKNIKETSRRGMQD